MPSGYNVGLQNSRFLENERNCSTKICVTWRLFTSSTSNVNHMIRFKRLVQETCAVAQWARAKFKTKSISLVFGDSVEEPYLSPAVEYRQHCSSFCGFCLSSHRYRRSSRSNCRHPSASICQVREASDRSRWRSCPSDSAASARKV